MFNFEKLIAYQETKKLVGSVYTFAGKISQPEGEVLKKQIKKTIVEVPCAIAEGMSLATTAEKIVRLDVAYSTIARVNTLLQIAVELGFVNASELDAMSEEMLEVSKVVLGLKRKLRGDTYYREDYSSRNENIENESVDEI